MTKVQQVAEVKKKVIVVGGGFAGVKAALKLSNNRHFDVELIAPHGRFEYHGAMYRSATGRSPLEAVIPLTEIFAKSTNVTTTLDSVTKILPKKKEVIGETGRAYKYDILIMSTGYVINHFNIEGMAEHSESTYSIAAAIKLRRKLVDAFLATKTGQTLSINIIGAGPTGVEIASDIKNFAKIVEGKRGLPTINIKPRLIEAGPRVLPGLSEENSKIARERLESIGVEVRLGTMVTKCSETSISTDAGEFEGDITVWTAGNKASPLYSAHPKMFKLNKTGRVEVGKYFEIEAFANVYVIGDAANTKYSGMAQTALHNAIALTDNLKRAAEGKKMAVYRPKKPDFVIPIGGEWAILETDKETKIGAEGWTARRNADLWVLENFLVYDLANRHFKQGDRIADF